MRKPEKDAMLETTNIERYRETKRLISDINYDILRMRQDLQALRMKYDGVQAELQRLKQEVNTCRK